MGVGRAVGAEDLGLTDVRSSLVLESIGLLLNSIGFPVDSLSLLQDWLQFALVVSECATDEQVCCLCLSKAAQVAC